ncbi:Phthioceranic/hydroxyphthioceranic acid synthase [Streptomyces sp. YIM 130001]|uniref:type I polyketide synthase n=1 Tax=Streptomyces sp. YIM 130001 TaxID=2259644 RepID=UPI000E64EE3C|nr:type I polyketide synthase [Streptomyces sp. YIM 130001]RII14710.1 Phthioceranic/hydroxyphthioceranic acid synthase [Streptomyces sp. YIM 130001]
MATPDRPDGGGQVPVAVVGMEVFLPGAPDLAAYWHSIRNAVDAVTEVPADRWDADTFYDPTAGPRSDRFYCRRGGFVDASAEFDPTRFGMMPNSVPGTEPDQLIALDVAHRSIEDAGGERVLPARRERAGIVLGRGGYLTPGLVRLDQRVRTANQLVHTLRELAPQLDESQLEAVRAEFTARLGPEQPESAIGLVPNLVASRVANRLDLRGPAYTVDAACASSLVAVDHAVRELGSGRCDVMLAGGVHHCHDLTLWSVFTQLGALSRSERIRPLHRDADGVLIGEGTGVVVLKRLDDARRDGDRVYAVLRGTGVAGDGRSASLFNPDPGGQIRAVRQAWDAAGLDPRAADALQLLEAHGTATPAGDRAELATVAEVFGPAAGERAVIGSVKSQIGHTMPAAGIAGLVKAALALYHEELPPTLHCDDPSPALDGTRFAPLDRARPWREVAGGAPRRAAVNAFGFGGINAHVVLEQPAPVPTRRPRATVTEPERVLRLAAPTTDELAARLAAHDGEVLAAGLPETRAAANQGGRVRLGIVDPTARRLKLARKAVAKGEPWRGRSDVWFTPRPVLGASGGRTAFLFPGLEAEFDAKVEKLAQRFGLDWEFGAGAPVGDVGRHGAAVFQLGRLLDSALRRIGVTPDAVAGHSVGEWTAMAAAGVHAPEEVDAFLAGFDPDALRVPGLAFAVLGTRADQVLGRLAGRGDVVLSHDNAPSQSMICGPEAAVTELVAAFRADGVIAQVLPFRSGFHTPMLAPYLDPIRRAADTYTVHAPHVPVWSATTAEPFPVEPAAVRDLFVRHLLEPVRFRQLILAQYAAGFRAFVTLGAGQLGSLVDETLAGRDRLVVPAHSTARDSLDQLRRVATALWTEGAAPDATALTGDRQPSRTPRASRPGRPGIRLDLGGALVSLPERSHGLLEPGTHAGPETGRAASPAPRVIPEPVRSTRRKGKGVVPPEPTPAHARAHEGRGNPADLGTAPRVAEHAALAAEHAPLTAELSALLSDTASLTEELLDAAQAGRTAVPRPARRGRSGPGRPARGADRVHEQPAAKPAPAQPSPAPGAHGPELAPVPGALRIDVADMPYLLDHCFFRQRPGWPDDGDRWPVVPATTVVHHLMRIAERALPGLRVVAVHDVTLQKWIVAVPASDVPVTLHRLGPDRLEVRLTGYAGAVLQLAPRHGSPPEPWTVDPAEERAPALTAEQLYSERWMFHGPEFQGVRTLTAIGDRHVRGVLTAPGPPGALLDNVGQLLGYWIMDSLTERTTVFPVSMRSMAFHGPDPEPGSTLDCHIRITDVTHTTLTADMQLSHEGKVWAELTGWTDRRFDTDPGIRRTDRFPGRNTLSQLQPGGWTLVHERWPDLATRELIMRNMLAGEERTRHETQPPGRRRRHLLGRIAAKDAIRELLWSEGAHDIYPGEIALHNDEFGRPIATGVHGRQLGGDLVVSLAHCKEAAVALAHRGGPCGIDLEEVTDRPAATLQSACAPAERELLTHVSEGSTKDAALWFTRFWAAKEAVAKALGTGLQGRPDTYRVTAAHPDRLQVEHAGSAWEVRCSQVAAPSGLPQRSYVVAWTTGVNESGERHDH